jgi:hypothetical protein
MRLQRIILGSVVGVFAVAAMGYCCGGYGGNINDYLAKDGNLKEKLTLHIGHGSRDKEKYGVTFLVIEPSGAWTRQTRWSTWLIGETTPAAKGQLNQQQRAALARHLATQDLQSLPARVSVSSEPIGLAVWKLDFGKKSTQLESAAVNLADAAPSGGSKAEEWSRFVALTLVLEDLCKRTKVEPKNDK